MRFNLSSTRHRDRLRCLSALTIVGLSALSASPAVAFTPSCGWDTNGSAAGPMTGVPLDSPIRIESGVSGGVKPLLFGEDRVWHSPTPVNSARRPRREW